MHEIKQIRAAVPYGALPNFQPIVELTGKLSYEALGRLVVGGDTLTPNCFLPLIEGTQLMVDFDREITAKAIAQVGRWNAGLTNPIHLHVNASKEALSDPGYLYFIREVLMANKLEPQLLTVEVIESCSFWQEPRVIDTLLGLRRLGVDLAIDDFPCWADPEALMLYLRQQTIDFSTLKLDQSLVLAVSREDVSPKEFGEAERYIEFARELGMHVVAEGVEDSEQALTMQMLGVDALQGFGIGRPEPATRAYHLTWTEEEESQMASIYRPINNYNQAVNA